MNKEVIWGVPTQRTKKEEKFNTPVVTMSSLEKKGAGRKFSFNKASQEALGLEGKETYVVFGFSNGKIFVMASNDEHPNGFLLTASCTFSNKKTYEFIAKSKDLDTNTENYLHLSPVEGQPYYEVTSIQSESDEITVEEDVPQVNDDTAEQIEINQVEEPVVASVEENDEEWG